MAKIYISSTYVDLKKEREAAAKAIRRLEDHQVVAMEDYVAADQRPVDKCLQDVSSSDVYVGIFAWRYGFIPDIYDKSITHLEYEAARKAGLPCLVFLLEENAPWPVHHVSTGEERDKIDQLRNKLKNEHTVSFFNNADELSGLVSAAVGNLISMAERSFIKFKSPGDLIGTRLGKYVILEKLGKGGKGVVFKVMDTLEEREKAIKMVPPRIADSPVAFKELKREINTAACIIHPHVVKVLGLEEVDSQFFIVMEYIEGQSLEQILADSKEGKLEETQVIDIMKKLALGLLETHKKNVIHRDIKPSNVMLIPEGQVKILDFGISYQVTTSMTELVGEHHRTGTWPYMAPEQLSTRYGRENKQVDIWGFGVTMYQLLTGKFPFIDKDQIKDSNEKPYELAGVSRKVRNLVMKCLEKDRKNRFQNMEEVLEALNAVSMVKVREKAKIKVKKEPHRKWILMAASIIVLVVLSVFLIDRLKPGDKHSGEKQEAEIKQKEYEKYAAAAQNYYNRGEYDKAQENITRAEPIKITEPLKTLKTKIQAKIEEKKQKELKKKDDLAYKKASAQNTIAAYQAYLDKYTSGSHMNEAENKLTEFKKMPDDVRKVAAGTAKVIKVYETKKDLWEADYGDGIIMVYIPAGTFTMGSNDYPDEKSPHEVDLGGYWLGKTEVTKKQFELFVKDKVYVTEAEESGGAYTWTGEKWEPKEGIDWKNPGFKQDENHPVVCVSWNDAVEYCEWLSGKKGVNFKLPTEAQWEKAARGTDQRKYPWGKNDPYYNGEWYANYVAHDSWERRREDGFEFTSTVGFYPQGASTYGLLDMAGNVWEWCSDWYGSDYYKNINAPKKNPPGPLGDTTRVLRGGSWYFYAVNLRCSDRSNGRPSERGGDAGFRLCQDN